MNKQLTYEDQLVNDIVKALCQPQNVDLLIAVRDLGDSPDENFMWGFHRREAMSFDDFCMFNQMWDNEIAPRFGLEPDYRTTSDRFDDYLERVAANNAQMTLDDTQTARFNALINTFDDGSWSGAFYGFIMRKVQFVITQMWAN